MSLCFVEGALVPINLAFGIGEMTRFTLSVIIELSVDPADIAIQGWPLPNGCQDRLSAFIVDACTEAFG